MIKGGRQQRENGNKEAKKIWQIQSQVSIMGLIADKDQLGQMMSWSRKLMSDRWWAGVERQICGHVSRSLLF